MIEVKNIKLINKGSLIASCDVRLSPMKYTFRSVKIFEKGANRWISLPTIEKEYNGEKKYLQTGEWDDEETKNHFRDQVLSIFDKQQNNSNTRKELEELPF